MYDCSIRGSVHAFICSNKNRLWAEAQWARDGTVRLDKYCGKNVAGEWTHNSTYGEWFGRMDKSGKDFCRRYLIKRPDFCELTGEKPPSNEKRDMMFENEFEVLDADGSHRSQ